MRTDRAWSPLVILGLVALLVLVTGLLVAEKAAHFDRSGVLVAADTGIVSGQQFNWRLVTSWPKNFPGLGMAPERFAELVDRMSGGRLTIHVYGGGELVPALGVFDAVSSGAVEMGHSAAYYYKGKIPEAVFFTGIPFGMNAQEMNAWFYYGDGLKLWREAYAPFNILPFPGGSTGVQMGGWFNKEIRSMEDIRGLKMRIPGLAGEVFSRAGGTAVNIAGGDIYTSMQTGVIDATEWVGPYNDRSFGLQEVASHYYYPGWHEPGSSMEFEINLNAWRTLPPDLQAIVQAAARAVNADMLDEYTMGNARALDDLIAAGIQPQPFPEQVLEGLRATAADYYEEQAARDPDFARVYESYRRFQEMTTRWHRISEQAVYDLR